MGSVNVVHLVGNLGRDAEYTQTNSGITIAKCSVATTTKHKTQDGQWEDQTEWSRIVIFGKTAEALREYLVKGKQVYIQGRMQTRSWDKDGQKHYMTEVVADRVQLLGGGPRQERNNRDREYDQSRGDYDNNQRDESAPVSQPYEDEDVPF